MLRMYTSGGCAEEVAGYVPSSSQRDGVSGQQETDSQRPGCKKLHVSLWLELGI